MTFKDFRFRACSNCGANFIIAAADSIMRQSNRELLDAVMPEVPMEDGLGDHQSMLNCDKAARLLGWRPRHSWRDILKSD